MEDDETISCDICGEWFSSQRRYDIHVDGLSHRELEFLHQQLRNLDKEEEEPPIKDADTSTYSPHPNATDCLQPQPVRPRSIDLDRSAKESLHPCTSSLDLPEINEQGLTYGDREASKRNSPVAQRSQMLDNDNDCRRDAPYGLVFERSETAQSVHREQESILSPDDDQECLDADETLNGHVVATGATLLRFNGQQQYEGKECILCSKHPNLKIKTKRAKEKRPGKLAEARASGHTESRVSKFTKRRASALCQRQASKFSQRRVSEVIQNRASKFSKRRVSEFLQKQASKVPERRARELVKKRVSKLVERRLRKLAANQSSERRKEESPMSLDELMTHRKSRVKKRRSQLAPIDSLTRRRARSRARSHSRSGARSRASNSTLLDSSEEKRKKEAEEGECSDSDDDDRAARRLKRFQSKRLASGSGCKSPFKAALRAARHIAKRSHLAQNIAPEYVNSAPQDILPASAHCESTNFALVAQENSACLSAIQSDLARALQCASSRASLSLLQCVPPLATPSTHPFTHQVSCHPACDFGPGSAPILYDQLQQQQRFPFAQVASQSKHQTAQNAALGSAPRSFQSNAPPASQLACQFQGNTALKSMQSCSQADPRFVPKSMSRSADQSALNVADISASHPSQFDPLSVHPFAASRSLNQFTWNAADISSSYSSSQFDSLSVQQFTMSRSFVSKPHPASRVMHHHAPNSRAKSNAGCPRSAVIRAWAGSVPRRVRPSMLPSEAWEGEVKIFRVNCWDGRDATSQGHTDSRQIPDYSQIETGGGGEVAGDWGRPSSTGGGNRLAGDLRRASSKSRGDGLAVDWVIPSSGSRGDELDEHRDRPNTGVEGEDSRSENLFERNLFNWMENRKIMDDSVSSNHEPTSNSVNTLNHAVEAFRLKSMNPRHNESLNIVDRARGAGLTFNESGCLRKDSGLLIRSDCGSKESKMKIAALDELRPLFSSIDEDDRKQLSSPYEYEAPQDLDAFRESKTIQTGADIFDLMERDRNLDPEFCELLAELDNAQLDNCNGAKKRSALKDLSRSPRPHNRRDEGRPPMKRYEGTTAPRSPESSGAGFKRERGVAVVYANGSEGHKRDRRGTQREGRGSKEGSRGSSDGSRGSRQFDRNLERDIHNLWCESYKSRQSSPVLRQEGYISRQDSQCSTRENRNSKEGSHRSVQTDHSSRHGSRNADRMHKPTSGRRDSKLFTDSPPKNDGGLFSIESLAEEYGKSKFSFANRTRSKSPVGRLSERASSGRTSGPGGINCLFRDKSPSFERLSRLLGGQGSPVEKSKRERERSFGSPDSRMSPLTRHMLRSSRDSSHSSSRSSKIGRCSQRSRKLGQRSPVRLELASRSPEMGRMSMKGSGSLSKSPSVGRHSRESKDHRSLKSHDSCSSVSRGSSLADLSNLGRGSNDLGRGSLLTHDTDLRTGRRSPGEITRSLIQRTRSPVQISESQDQRMRSPGQTSRSTGRESRSPDESARSRGQTARLSGQTVRSPRRIINRFPDHAMDSLSDDLRESLPDGLSDQVGVQPGGLRQSSDKLLALLQQKARTVPRNVVELLARGGGTKS